MREIHADAEIPAPPDALFDFIADPANLPRWQTGVVAAKQTSDGPVGVGSIAHVVRELLGQRLAVDLTVTGYEPGRRLALESAASGLRVAATLDLSPAADGTRIRFGMTISAKSPLMTPLEGMVAGAAERDLADSLERLRRHFATDA